MVFNNFWSQIVTGVSEPHWFTNRVTIINFNISFIAEQKFEYESFILPETLIATNIVKQEPDESIKEPEEVEEKLQSCDEENELLLETKTQKPGVCTQNIIHTIYISFHTDIT